MRYTIIKITYLLAAFLIVLRLGYWQIVKSDELVSRGEKQRVISKTLVATRGDILFADHSVLASIQPAYTIYIQPQVIKEERGKSLSELNSYNKYVRGEIAKIFLEEDQEFTLSSDDVRRSQLIKIEQEIQTFLDQDLNYVSLGRVISFKSKQRLAELELVGISFERVNTRFYPEGSSSAHLLGFVGSDIYGKDTGYFGLEGFYNGELKGKNGQLTQEKDALGLPILIGKFVSKEAERGKTLVLNIDRTIQHIVEKNLKEGMVKYQAKGGSVIIMEPDSGNILAMASYPNYDQSRPDLFKKDLYKNPLTADGYEPGSTFKVLTMAAGINEKAVKEDTICDVCAGPLSISGFAIRTWNNQYKANSTMTDTIIHSDNTGMVFMARRLGKDKLYDYIKKFGFGEITGVDLQDETSPFLRPKDEWKDIDLATASFGQGVSVTGLQIVRAVASIANGGKLMEPHMVGALINGDKVYNIKPKIVRETVSKDTALKVTEMMVRAVDEGEAKFVKPKGYKVAGKTGTAQIPILGHYDPTKTIASFVGFAPADKPKFVMLVRFTEPTSSIFGSETAAPTFFAIAKELFLYYGIAPQE